MILVAAYFFHMMYSFVRPLLETMPFKKKRAHVEVLLLDSVNTTKQKRSTRAAAATNWNGVVVVVSNPSSWVFVYVKLLYSTCVGAAL